MTTTLLANPASLPSNFPFGLLSMYHHKGSSEGKQYNDNGTIMNSLVSGSIAESNGRNHVRPSAPRIQEPYDPFASQYRRYSPPRSYENSPTADAFSSAKTLPLYSNNGVRPSLPQGSATFPVSDDSTYFHRDVQQRPVIVDENLHCRRQSLDSYGPRTSSPLSQDYIDYEVEERRRDAENQRNTGRYQTRRRPFNQDEFDGPSQYLPLPLPKQDSVRAQDLVSLPVSLDQTEQEEVIRRANNILSECAYHFVAKYQFPVPLERDKPRVQVAADREWTEWAYLLKRLATKRRIPARVLFDNQIKQFVTVLENSIATRQGINKGQMNSKQKPKDDWYILQLVSAGVQVSKILMDSLAMQQLCDLYNQTETVITERRRRHNVSSTSA